MQFLRKEFIFLGHDVLKDGILPDQSKIDALLKYPIPKMLQTRAFL